MSERIRQMSTKRTANWRDPNEEEWATNKRRCIEIEELREFFLILKHYLMSYINDHIQYLPPEVLIMIFKYLSLNEVARSVARVCRQWKEICYTKLEPQQLHAWGPYVGRYTYAVENYKINALIVTEASVEQIATLLLASAQQDRIITTLVAHGITSRSRMLFNREFHILAEIKELSIDAGDIGILVNFPKVSRLQLLHNRNFLSYITNTFDHTEELAVDVGFLKANCKKLLKLFPYLKKIHVMNDPQFTILEREDTFKEQKIELMWPMNQVEDLPYHHFYYRMGNTMATSDLPALITKWKKATKSASNDQIPNMTSSENRKRVNITSFEYERELQTRPAEYHFPSTIDFYAKAVRPNLATEIENQIAIAADDEALDMIVNEQLLPYWTMIDKCRSYNRLDLLRQLLKHFKCHISSLRHSVIESLIGSLGLTELLENILGVEDFIYLVNSQNSKGNAIAHRLAKAKSSIVFVNALVPFIRTWNVVNNNGVRPVDYAVQTWNMPFVLCMLLHGENFEHFDNFSPSFLSYVISSYGKEPHRKDLADLILELVKHHGVSINFPDSNGETPLGVAIKTGNSNVVKLVMDLGANINFPCDSNNMKAIPFICSHITNIDEFKTMINCMLEYGADINTKTVQFYDQIAWEISPIFFLLDKPNPELFIKYMVDHGASLYYVDPYNYTLLHYFIQETNYNEKLIRLLEQRLQCSVTSEGGEQYLTIHSVITPEISENILMELLSDQSSNKS